MQQDATKVKSALSKEQKDHVVLAGGSCCIEQPAHFSDLALCCIQQGTYMCSPVKFL